MTMKKQVKNILYYGIIIVLVIILGVFMFENYQYNHTLRVGDLTDASFDGKIYNFGDVGVQITTRGGDSGAWLKDPIYDDDGNMLHGPSVGTIYEAVIINQSKNIVKDWTLQIPINEMMWVNNNWNSKMEIHQDVNGNEKVLAIDLSDYSEYDINLDYYIDHTGPMIPLYEGDYFIYLPDEIAEEKPISPAKKGEIGEATARFGYIMYIPDQDLDYVADFSGGEINYYMYANPLSKAWFWILTVLIFIWFVSLVIILIVKYKIKKLVQQQIEQKKHDQKMVRQTMQLIINMIENKDTSTKGHSIRVAEYSKLMAEQMGMSEDECMDIYYIGLMHDCGKVNIPDSILKNPGKLSNDEYQIMKKHTVYGGDILKDFSSIQDIDIGAKYHHERYDGMGYPVGLQGEEIPMIARIIGVADSFDAMNSERCYRDRLPESVILKELTENKSKQFDPTVVDCLLDLIKQGKIVIERSGE